MENPIELEIADSQIMLMQGRIDALVSELDDEEVVKDETRRSALLGEAAQLALQVREWQGQYLQSLNGNSGHYVDMMDQQKERLEEIRRSYSY